VYHALVRSKENKIQKFKVIVPDGVSPGHLMKVKVDNRIVMLICPKHAKPGQSIQFELTHL